MKIKNKNKLAIVSLVLALIAFSTFIFYISSFITLLSIPAIFLGFLSLKSEKKAVAIISLTISFFVFFAHIMTSDTTLRCYLEEIMVGQENTGYCWGTVAIAKQDLSLCDKIQREYWDPGWKSWCYSHIAAAKQDLSICDKLQEQSEKNYCYSWVAEDKQDASICEMIIGSEIDKSFCRALSKQDALFCKEIEEELEKVDCYLHVARKKKDPSICEEIQDQRNRDACIFHSQIINDY